MSFIVGIKDAHVVVYGDLPSKLVGTFTPDAQGCIQLGAFFAERGMTGAVMCSSTCDFPDEGGLPGFDARGFVADALRGAANLRAAQQAPDSLERQLETAHLAVVDAANEWETDPENPGNRAALCAAVRAWRKAGEAFVRSQRT